MRRGLHTGRMQTTTICRRSTHRPHLTSTRSKHMVERVPTVYTNVFSLAFGDNDVTLDLGFERRKHSGEKTVEQQVTVVLTPRSAKILAHALATTIEAFEQKRGPIEVP